MQRRVHAGHEVGGRAVVRALGPRDGREPFYLSAAHEMIAVAMGADGSSGAPRALFRLGHDLFGAEANSYTPWDVAPDGRAFLMARRAATAADAAAPVVVVEHWFGELRRKTGSR